MRLALALLVALPCLAEEAPFFQDVSEAAGLSVANSSRARWVDVDGDGWCDLVVLGPDTTAKGNARLFRAKGDGTFVDATAESGLNGRVSSVFVAGDVDDDGDADIVVGTNNMRLTAEQQKSRPLRIALFQNQVGNRNHWIGVRVVGGPANRLGIGALVRVTAGGVTQTREVFGGQGHCGHQDAPEALFGLAQNEKIDRVEVVWPDSSRAVREVKGAPLDRWIEVTQGKDGYR